MSKSVAINILCAILPILFFTVVSDANPLCFQDEINPETNLIYENQASYNKDVDFWKSEKPPTPSLVALGVAYLIYKSELSEALKLGYDKREHCYMGCRIAQGTSINTAIYVGWKKESRDLNDCDASTDFDPLDFAATEVGARAATSIEYSQAACSKFCADNI